MNVNVRVVMPTGYSSGAEGEVPANASKAATVRTLIALKIIPQLSLAMGGLNVYAALHMPGSALRITFAGQPLITGGVVSTMTIATLHVVEFPAASVALMVITCTPLVTVFPAAGVCTQVSVVEQLSVPAASGNRSGTSALQLPPIGMVRAVGQVIIMGGTLSPTSTVCVPLRTPPQLLPTLARKEVVWVRLLNV